jgi:hypothetical protein
VDNFVERLSARPRKPTPLKAGAGIRPAAPEKKDERNQWLANPSMRNGTALQQTHVKLLASAVLCISQDAMPPIL